MGIEELKYCNPACDPELGGHPDSGCFKMCGRHENLAAHKDSFLSGDNQLPVGWVDVDSNIKPVGFPMAHVDCWITKGRRVADCMYVPELGSFIHHSGTIDVTHWMYPPKAPNA